MAEYLAKHHAKTKNLTNLNIYSRGLTDHYSAWGSPANPKALKVLKEKYGMDMKDHQSKYISDEDLDTCDVIFVVTTTHIRWIRSSVTSPCFDRNKHKLRTCGPDVPDPFFFKEQAYIDCGVMLLEQVGSSLDAFLRGEPGTTEQSPESENRANTYYNTWERDPSVRY